MRTRQHPFWSIGPVLGALLLAAGCAGQTENSPGSSTPAGHPEGQPVADTAQGRGPEPQASSSLKLSIGQCSLLGNFREENDHTVSARAFPDWTLCLVADGLGGLGVGPVASKRAAEFLPRMLQESFPRADTPEAAQEAIRLAVVAANKDIMALGARDRRLRNLGTTVVLAAYRPGGPLYVAGVGDSRAYLVRGKAIEQLTVDHSLAQALVEAGTITVEQARTHRFRNVLWKFLGSKEVGAGPEVRAVSLKAGDRVLLCTTGLTGVVADDRLLDCVRAQADPQQCADALGQRALDSGSRDNVSCLVIAAQ
jgi:protein phosphatase